MSRLGKEKLNRIEVDIVDAPAFEIGIKIKKKISGISVFTKMTALILLIVLNFNGILAIRDTVSYYSNTESSPGNVYAAGTLDFSLDSVFDFSPSPVCPGQSAERTVNFINLANLPKYQVSAASFAGELCDYLDLSASLDGTSTYTGSLKSFITGINLFSQPDDWAFVATLQAGTPVSVQGQTCQFKFVFLGSQERNSLPFGMGFNDTEEVDNTITACIWERVLINKVYYDVDDNHGAEFESEWVELYNPLDTPVDISGWEICDNNSCDTIPASAPIPSHGFAVIAGAARTWNLWDIPGDVVKIILADGEIGNGLANTADMLLLENASSTILDQMNWGAPTSTWPNYNSGVWDPGVPGVPEGHMLARVPTGTDTDTPADWHDLGLPQVTVVWPNDGEILYVGNTYALQWTAINPNGPDSALSIDIYYSSDSGDTWAKITSTSTTENDGAYEWRVPLYIGSYYVPSHTARIKVMAYGPENFMVWAWDMSDFDFCPPIDYGLLTDEERAQVEQLLLDGILTEADIINRESVGLPEISGDEVGLLWIPAIEETATATEEAATTTEYVATTTEEIIPPVDETATTTVEEATTTEEVATTTEDIGIIGQIDGVIDGVIDEIIEEIMPVETPVEEEIPAENTPVINETAVIAAPEGGEPSPESSGLAETPSVEGPVVEQAPATEEQPVAVPEVVAPENPEPAPDNGEI